ncbi:magnesium transporter CorA family protein [archaeon]|jgi:magnesium transporter|nr:magnesium transporter CorA family protein [archaeon]
MITYYKKALKDRKLKKLKSYEKGCWVNVVNPTEKEIKYLSETYELDEQNIISGTDKNEIPRVEKSEEGIYILLKILSPNKKELETFLIVITKNFILTLSRTQPKFITNLIDGTTKFTTTLKITSLLKLLATINEEFEKATLRIVRSVNSEKKSLIDKLSERDINSLLLQEDTLNNYVSSYYYTSLVYERIIKHIKLLDEDKEQMEDLKIEARQGLDLCRASLKKISNLRNHLEVTLSNKLNKLITALTVFTILITVPAAISGIYGMNITLPLQNNPFAFYYILASIVAIWGIFIFYLKQKN